MQKNVNSMFYLYFLVLFWPLAVDLYIPVMPAMAQSLSVSISKIQDTVLFFTLGFGVGQFLVGYLADRYGRRLIALCGIALYFISSFSVVCLDLSIEAIMLSRLIQGMAASATTVSAYASLRDSADSDLLSTKISFLNGAVCFSPALGPIVGSALAEFYGWKSSFFAMSMFALLGFIILYYGFKETNITSNKKTQVGTLSAYKEIVLNKAFIFYSVTVLLSMSVLLLYVTTASSWLISELKLSIHEFTYWYGVNAIINIIGSLLIAPYLLNRYGLYRSLVIGLCIVIVGGVIMLQGGKTPLMFMIPIFFNSISFALIFSVSYGQALALFPNSAALAAALFGLMQMGGAAIFLAVTQRLISTTPILIAIHMLLLIPVLLFLVTKKKPLLNVLVKA